MGGLRRFLKGLGVFILESLAMVLAAFVASLAFPSPFDDEGWGWIAFVSLVPVFYVINRTRWSHAPFLGLVYGFMFYIFYNYWLSTFHPLAILIAPILESVQYMVLFPVLKSATSLFGKRSHVVQAFFYVAYLYLTQQGFLGYPYGNLSSAVTGFRVLIQIADITGIWGICLVMTLTQTLAAKMLVEHGLSAYYVDVMLVVSLYLAMLIYGMFAIWRYECQEPDRIVRIASVQHSADSWEGGDATYRRNFETLTALTEEALEEEPDLVAWSETAFVPSVTWNMQYPITPARYRLTKEFVDFGLSMPVPLVTGNPESVIADESLPPVLSDGTMNWKKYNTVILFADGQVGYISAGFVSNGADFLLNMTNDVWSGAVPAEVQHMQLAVFRAIENRRPLVRSTNSGISCMVTTTGEVVDPMEPFTQSWHIYEVPIVEDAGLTFYTMFPDLFAKLFTIIAFSCLAFGIGRRLYS